MSFSQQELDQIMASVYKNCDQRYANRVHNHQGVHSESGHNHHASYYEKDDVDGKLAQFKYGRQYEFGRREGRNSTNSVAGRPLLSFLYLPLNPGIYRIGWSYSYSYDSTEYNFWSKIKLNDREIFNHRDAPSRVHGTYANHHNSKLVPISGFDCIELEDGVQYTLTLFYGSSSKDFWSVIENPTIEIYRVA